MEVIKLIPRGFCIGVVRSINIAKKVAIEHKEKKIYMIGMLVHNKHIINELENENIILLNDLFKNREEIINTIPKGSVVIFSAHGTDLKIVELAKQRGLIVYDTVCEWVEVTRNLILDYINQCYEIVFIGKKNHPETKAMLSIEKNIKLIENIEDIDSLKLQSNKIFCTNQTTLSTLKTNDIYKHLKIKYPTMKFANDICLATTERQQAILNLKGSNIDLIIVVGDSRSSNTNELINIGNSIGIKSILVEDVTSIDKRILKNVKTVAVTAGASTSSVIQNNVINFLESL